MPTEFPCTCPNLINGHYPGCPYATRASRRVSEVQKRMLNRRSEEDWEPLDEVCGSEGCTKDCADGQCDDDVGTEAVDTCKFWSTDYSDDDEGVLSDGVRFLDH